MNDKDYANALARIRPLLIPSDYQDLLITNRIKPYQHSWYVLRQRKGLAYATSSPNVYD